MRTFRSLGSTYGLPTIVLLGSLGIMLALFDDPDMVWGFFVAPPIATLLGFLFTPRRVWITPLAVSLIIATTIVVAALLVDFVATRPLYMHFVYSPVLIGLPLLAYTALGKFLRGARDTLRLDWKWKRQQRQFHP